MTPFKPSATADLEKIARARRLLKEEGYPSEKVMESIAQHLAKNWADLPNHSGPSAQP